MRGGVSEVNGSGRFPARQLVGALGFWSVYSQYGGSIVGK